MAAPIRSFVACQRTINCLKRSIGINLTIQRKLSVSRLCRQHWQLCSAVCLERSPVVSAKPNPIEESFHDMMSTMELEYSKLCDHEWRHMEDLRLAERRKQDDYEETEAEAIKQTAVEAEDAWEMERQKFIPGSQTTEADNSGDMKTTDRALDRKLVLLVKQKLGDTSHWVFPQLPRDKGESMRQAAEKTLSSLCGDGLNVQFMGNAPCGFFKYKFPPKTCEEGPVGAKVFFLKAAHHGGQINYAEPEVCDHVWVTQDELPEYLRPEYHKAVTKFMLEL